MRRKVENKHRPLLVCFESADDKVSVVSHSYLLHRHDQFKRVFIVPDRTVLQREKHQRLVIQLRERKSRGETGLIIRNGSIITRHPHTAGK